MNSLEEILIKHGMRYPHMQPKDAVKLLYQNEFGGGHFIFDEASCLQRLTDEYQLVEKDSHIPMFEPIGNGLVRLNLASVNNAKLPLELVNKIFTVSSGRVCGSKERFIEKLDMLRGITKAGVFSFTLEQLEQYLKAYREEGYFAVNHSDTYRKQYAPAYRIILEEYAGLLPMLACIIKMMSEKAKIFVAIDGNSASGKTTAAEHISAIFDCNIIHMDDFFLPFSMRSEERLAEAGGNIHYERLKEEVTDKLGNHEPFSYRVFDCSIGDYVESNIVIPKGLTVMEGAYSMHPYLGNIYDIKILFYIDEIEQKIRILKRNGEQMLRKFEDIWIPMENKYLREYNIEEGCNFTVENYGADERRR